MDRPTTSKARGACRYYLTPRGCFAGDSCKFLHGDEQRLTPYDQSKPCVFYAKGYCRRGEECWFRHVAPESSTPQKPDDPSDTSAAEDVCNICLEKPVTYGLLTGCGHVFCIKCIRQWRDPAGKSGEMSGVIKKCPLCRAPSRYITPSSISFPHDHPGKMEAVLKYKASMARVPCRYFQLSKPSKRFCPFGKDCFYQHLNDDGTPYSFPQGIHYYMKLYKFRHRNGTDTLENVAYRAAAATDPSNPLNLLNRFLNNPLSPLRDIQHTIENIRANFLDPWQIEGPDEQSGDEDDPTLYGDSDYGETDRVDALERLADRVLESLVALRDNTLPSPTPNVTRALNVHEDDYDGLPPLEPLESNSSSSESLASRETPSPTLASSIPSLSRPLSTTTAATSRFSTVVGNRSQERIFIDLVSEDEDDECEEQGTTEEGGEAGTADQLRTEPDAVNGMGQDREMVWQDNDVVRETSPQETEAYTIGRSVDHIIGQQTSLDESTNDDDTRIVPSPEPERDQLQPDAEPPFVTDGRGRVVWSSMRSARGTQAVTPCGSPAPTPPQNVHGGTGTTTASECRTKARRTGREVTAVVPESTAASGFTTDGRGRVIWAGNPIHTDVDGEVNVAGDNEGEGGERSGESAAVVAESSEEGPRRSFFGRVYDVVFS